MTLPVTAWGCSLLGHGVAAAAADSRQAKSTTTPACGCMVDTDFNKAVVLRQQPLLDAGTNGPGVAEAKLPTWCQGDRSTAWQPRLS